MKKLFGLIGYPLGHSFSRQYFIEKFAKENLADCSFENFAIPSIKEIDNLIATTPLLRGLSVTIPYKEQVLAFVHQLSDEVKMIGAANCIKIEAGVLTAHNTDTIGFEESFQKKLLPHHTKALVLGTGGASKAVQYVLQKMGIHFLLVSRSSSAQDNVIAYEMINKEMMENFSVIINCSPAGMEPNGHECPKVPYQFLTSKHYLFDLVYKPAKTLFLQKGEEAGCTVENGLEMLFIQAEANWKIWNS